ncbi:uncharacterized protein N0V89_000835 [Didymosphaeria variabile]|uniref:MFS general substrate transporter n=1 Tax=Didymosphaeria variabile TaxID=1932322 RepID=A0A9W9CG79_9PLEO|nr:uncharacterized protein N0V89_000835 [Didymosphaeria variabile]KAJ4360275.1 hypothetical protein N0V89_000835 [Didymosphaeria variabile]
MKSKPTTDSEASSITWNGPDDPENPFNFSQAKKWRITLLACFMTFVIQMNGTSMTSAAEQINESFHVSDESFPHSYWPVFSWTLSGAAAPMLGLPLMEHFGVRWSYMIIYAVLIIFLIPQAVAQNFATLIVTRIFTGGCSATLANITGDVMSLTQRRIFHSQIAFYSAMFPILFFGLPEVRPDVILTRRARNLRKTGKSSVYAEAELQHTSLGEILRQTVVRPTRMLCTEAVVFSFGMWSAFCVGTAYMFTQSIVQVYSALYGWTYYSTGLVQCALVVGEIIGLIASLGQDELYFRSAGQNTEEPGAPIPESRLFLSIPASFIGLAGGLFYFAWTSYSSVAWIVPTIALGFVGFGMFCSVTAVTTYVLDAYAKYAASAIAGAAFLENILAAFLPLATQSMYRTLGFHWASSLLGLLALGLSFVPVVLFVFGRKIREKSPFMGESVYVHDEAAGGEP